MKCSLGEILCFILRCIPNPSQNKLNFEHYVKTFKESRAESFPVEQRWAGGQQDAALRCCVLEGRPARKQNAAGEQENLTVILILKTTSAFCSDHRSWRWDWESLFLRGKLCSRRLSPPLVLNTSWLREPHPRH